MKPRVKEWSHDMNGVTTGPWHGSVTLGRFIHESFSITSITNQRIYQLSLFIKQSGEVVQKPSIHFQLRPGAQEVALCVCVSVCLCVTFMNSSLNLHSILEQSQSSLRAVLEQSQSSLRAVLEQSQSILRALLTFLERHILSHAVGAQNTSSCFSCKKYFPALLL